jgi:hypothetical protein
LQEGLYKVEFYTVHGTGTGVIYAASGKLRGGNTGFSFIGSYTGRGDDIDVKISTHATTTTRRSGRCSGPT